MLFRSQIDLLRRVRLSKVAEVRWKIKSDSAKMAGQKRGETNNEPFLQAEGLKQNLRHQFKGFPKRFEDFDFAFGFVHAFRSGGGDFRATASVAKPNWVAVLSGDTTGRNKSAGDSVLYNQH